jgi:hypothetical protein
MFKHLLIFAAFSMFSTALIAQSVEASKAKSWSLAGRVQLQHLYDNSIDADAATNNNGFRMRRTRLEVKAKLTDWVAGKIQIEVRDNDPRLKDAEVKINLYHDYEVRLGQFKVPVWREELRSSGSLLLVERSAAAAFLEEHYLSARHIGLELVGSYKNGIGFAVNYSNGAGEGGREDAGRTRYSQVDDTTFTSTDEINNGKLLTARINIPIKKVAEIGVSFALNQLGNEITEYGINTEGNVYVVAPDFGLYFPFGLEVEGGVAIGAISKDLLGKIDNEKFNLFDMTAQWKKSMDKPIENLGGLDAFGFAGGISYIEPDTNTDDNEILSYRFGPVIYFGKNLRLQVNGEVEDSTVPGSDNIFKIRSQFTLNL